ASQPPFVRPANRQATLEFELRWPEVFRIEPPAFHLHAWLPGEDFGRVVTHVVPIGEFPGPYFYGQGNTAPALSTCFCLNPCSFFGNFQRLYSSCWGNPAMAINGRRNKPIGPGGSTRRLHQFRGSGNRRQE